MANTIRIKRRTGGASGAPSSLSNAELAFNEVNNTLYYGKGDDGNGTATSIVAIAGDGTFATKTYVDDAFTNANLSQYAKLAASNNFSSGYTNTFAGTTNFTGAIQIDSVAVNTSAAELNVLDNAAANTVVNSKAVIYGSAGEVAASSLSTTGNIVVGGNLTVNGTTTTINSTVVTIDDPIFTVGGDTAPVSDDNKDRGVAFQWHNGSAAKIGFFGYDDSASVFTFIPDATISSEVVSGTAGDLAVGKLNNVTVTTPASAATLTLGSGKTVTVSNTLTFTGTDSSSVAFGTGGTVAYTGNTLAVFSATTSSQLAGVISDETGSGALVFGTSPAFTTSVTTASTTFAVFNTSATTVNAFGAATALNMGASSGTTTVNNDLQLGAGKVVKLPGATSGTLSIAGPAAAGTNTITFPAETGTVVTTASVCTAIANCTVDGGTF